MRPILDLLRDAVAEPGGEGGMRVREEPSSFASSLVGMEKASLGCS